MLYIYLGDVPVHNSHIQPGEQLLTHICRKMLKLFQYPNHITFYFCEEPLDGEQRVVLIRDQAAVFVFAPLIVQ